METPSGRLIAAANREFSVVDAEGRRLLLRRPTALDRLRLFKAIGPNLAANDRYLGMAMLAACVTSVEEVPLPFPATEALVEAAVSRLGDAGIAAAASVLEPAPDEGSPQGN